MNIIVVTLACVGIKSGFSGKFLESLPQRTKLSRDLAVIKENRAERVGVQRLFDFDDSSVAKEGPGRVGSNTPYHSMARGILFIPGWYACSLVSSTESLFSTLRLFFPSLPPQRPMPQRSTILYQGGCQHGRLSLTTFSYIERNKYQCPIEENSHLHRDHTLATFSCFLCAIVTCWFNFSFFSKRVV